MIEMVERIARRLCEIDDINPDYLESGDRPQVDGHKVNGDPAHFIWRDRVEDARSILMLIRDPTDSMAEKGGEVDDGEGFWIMGDAAREVWRAMIDEAAGATPPEKEISE